MPFCCWPGVIWFVIAWFTRDCPPGVVLLAPGAALSAPAVPGVVPTPTPPAVAAPSVPLAVPDAPAPPEAPAPPDCPSALRLRPAMKIALTTNVKKHFI